MGKVNSVQTGNATNASGTHSGQRNAAYSSSPKESSVSGLGNTDADQAPVKVSAESIEPLKADGPIKIEIKGFTNTWLVAGEKIIRGSSPRSTKHAYTEEHAKALNSAKVNLVISFNERDLKGQENLTKYGIKYVHFPTEDFDSPKLADIIKAVNLMQNNDGKTYLHCGAGYGRTGTVFTGYQILTGEITTSTDLQKKGPENGVERPNQTKTLKTLLTSMIKNKL